tara:strand:- start:57604 stop:58155 length:552 start_codon:yes stop_codon:yes gene_type:complete
MKSKLFLFAFIISLCILSCDNDSLKSKNISEYSRSLNTWNTLKEINGTSYTYEVSSGSVFGFGSTTQITVKNNIVISRVYEAYSIYDNDNNYVGYDNRIISITYSENSENLGSNDSGASPVIIDDLYTTCLNDYLSVNSSSNTIGFEVDDSNIIKACYYVPNGCQDDCSTGITLTDFKWLETE